MQKAAGYLKRKKGRTVDKDPLRLTALLYLREALLEERYEECVELQNMAREFGATPTQIRFLLEDPRRMPVN